MTTIGVKSIMQRLRDETQEHHQRAEAKPLEQMMISGRPDVRLYTALLEQRFLVHRVLEEHVRRLSESDPRVSAIVSEELFQTDNLRSDLEHFGVVATCSAEGMNGEGVLDACPATRNLVAAIERASSEMPVALLGIYYVFEGSKNGARFIAGRLGPILGLTSGGPGMHYLDPHGGQQREIWKAFKDRMDAVEFSPAEMDAMVSAAQMTFDRVGEVDDEIMEAVRFEP